MSAPSSDRRPAEPALRSAIENDDWHSVRRLVDRTWPHLIQEHPDAVREVLVTLIDRVRIPARDDASTSDPTTSLSPRERTVLTELAAGGTVAEIADRLFVSRNTVKSQLQSAYRKLGVTTRAEAERMATRPGGPA